MNETNEERNEMNAWALLEDISKMFWILRPHFCSFWSMYIAGVSKRIQKLMIFKIDRPFNGTIQMNRIQKK